MSTMDTLSGSRELRDQILSPDQITGLVSGLLDDSSKLDGIVGKGFSHFDKDHSGFIEAHEISAAAQHMLAIAHLPQVPPQMLQSVSTKAAGADGRMDKAEFVDLFKQLLAKIRGNPAPVAEAAAAAGYHA